MFEVYKKETGLYCTNSYIVKDPVSEETAVIDPGVYDEEYEDFLVRNGVTGIKYILLTHGHFDHICGAYHLKKKYGGEILIHEEDAVCLENADASLTNSVSGYTQEICTADRKLSDNDEIYLGENKIRVIHSPGHTRGSILFVSEGLIFSGDTLFRGSMGRTDLPGGSTKTIFRTLRAIGQMQGEYRILPGHGEETTLSYEKRYNRYLRANDTSHT